MKKIIFLVSIFCLSNSLVRASQIWEVTNQDDGSGKQEAEYNDEDVIDPNSKPKSNFKNLSEKYRYEMKALVDVLQNYPKHCPAELAKLISEYCESYEFDKTIIDNTEKITAITQLKNGDLATCHSKRIKIWRPNSEGLFECIANFRGHNNDINSIIQINNGDFATCSDDKTIKIWHPSIDGSWSITTLKGHTSFVKNIIQLSNGDLASCSFDNTLRIWDVAADQIKTIPGKFQSIAQLNNGDLATCCGNYLTILHDNTDNSWSTTNVRSAHWLESVILLDNGDLLCKLWLEKIAQIWHKHSDGSWQCIQTLSDHQENIKKIIQLCNGDLASVADDKTIKIWRRNTNNNLFDCIQTLNCSEYFSSIFELNNGDLACYANGKIITIKRPFRNLFQKLQTKSVGDYISIPIARIDDRDYRKKSKILSCLASIFKCCRPRYPEDNL